MNYLIQSLRCLIGNHDIAMRKKVSNSRTELEFVCIHCGKKMEER